MEKSLSEPTNTIADTSFFTSTVKRTPYLFFLSPKEYKDLPSCKYLGYKQALKKYLDTCVYNVLLRIPLTYSRKRIVVDVKVVEIAEGEYPCLQGWHFDVLRNPLERSDTRPEIHHLVVNSESCFTEFVDERIELNGIESYDVQMERINSNFIPIRTVFVEPGRLYKYDRFALHRPSPAKQDEVRCLIRVTETDVI